MLQISNNRRRTETHQRIVYFIRRIGWLNGVTVFADHTAGIQTDVHLHDAHACLGIARFNRALNRRRTAPTGQQRGVDVETAVFRRIQHVLRQNQSVGGNDHHVGLDLFEHLQGFGVVAQFFRLRHAQTQFQCGLLHRRRGKLHPAPFGAVGLGQHQRDFKTGGGYGF